MVHVYDVVCARERIWNGCLILLIYCTYRRAFLIQQVKLECDVVLDRKPASAAPMTSQVCMYLKVSVRLRLE